jgi:hypothetical protein
MFYDFTLYFSILHSYTTQYLIDLDSLEQVMLYISRIILYNTISDWLRQSRTGNAVH